MTTLSRETVHGLSVMCRENKKPALFIVERTICTLHYEKGRLPCYRKNTSNALPQIKVLGGGGVGEETLLQKGPSPTSFQKRITKW